ncbi:unnamed protein product [Sphagnum balticum]
MQETPRQGPHHLDPPLKDTLQHLLQKILAVERTFEVIALSVKRLETLVENGEAEFGNQDGGRTEGVSDVARLRADVLRCDLDVGDRGGAEESSISLFGRSRKSASWDRRSWMRRMRGRRERGWRIERRKGRRRRSSTLLSTVVLRGWFVAGQPVRHSIAIPSYHFLCVIQEALLQEISIEIHEYRCISVKHGHHWNDPILQTGICYIVLMRQTFRVNW